MYFEKLITTMKKNLLFFIALFSLFGSSAWAQTFT